MVIWYTKAYLRLQSLVMCGSTFNLTEIEVIEEYDNFSNMTTWPIRVCRV